MNLIFVFILGLVVGSFLNAVIFRLASGESFLSGRSYCRNCKKQLQPIDLIPLFSFFVTRGRCRYCSDKLSWQYPLVEFLTGLLFVLVAIKFHMVLSFDLLLSLILICFLLVIAVYDFKHYLILDKVVFPAIFLAVLRVIYLDQSIAHIMPAILSGLGISGFFLLQYFVSRGRWIGLGDVKLGLLLGILAGWPQSLTLLMLAYFSGAIVGIALILSGRKSLGSKLPFGVFLGLSAIIIMLYGNAITGWYLKLIGL